MRLASLRIKNFGCYRGDHILELGPKVYAIVARMQDDVERSNWLGKSTLLESVIYALEGTHRHRYDEDLVSRGEAAVESELTFDEGTRILRSKLKGKRTSLYFFPRGGDPTKPLIQDEAQLAIAKFVGLSPDDFRATCYFEQKKMARFITTEPSKRMDMVSAWFRLDPLERCETAVHRMAASLEDTNKKLDGHLAALDQRKEDLARSLGWTEKDGLREAIDRAIANLDAELETRKGIIGALEDRLQKNAELLAARSRVTDYQNVVAEGKRAREEFDKVKLPVLQKAWEASSAHLAKENADLEGIAREVRQKRQLARGQFDGVCPVAEIECPAKAAINTERARNAELAAEAEKRHAEKAGLVHAASVMESKTRQGFQDAQRMKDRLDLLREQAKKLAEQARAAQEAGEPVDPIALRQDLEKERGDMLDAKGKVERLRAWGKELDDAVVTRKTLYEKKAEIAGQLGTFREAAVIFGKRGAQRRVAEGALQQIQDDANEMLRESGANLSIEARWSREGKGLASACEACGNPFPASAKVKHCERCGAARGPKLENKLDIVLSDWSGAAEDLAGAGIQLAASRWLREERGTSWSTALLDEPFGALDAAHRKGFASHLTAMLSGRYGFEQAFVVAHHASVLDALPGRIEIVSDGRWSVPRVVA